MLVPQHRRRRSGRRRGGEATCLASRGQATAIVAPNVVLERAVEATLVQRVPLVVVADIIAALDSLECITAVGVALVLGATGLALVYMGNTGGIGESALHVDGGSTQTNENVKGIAQRLTVLPM